MDKLRKKLTSILLEGKDKLPKAIIQCLEKNKLNIGEAYDAEAYRISGDDLICIVAQEIFTFALGIKLAMDNSSFVLVENTGAVKVGEMVSVNITKELDVRRDVSQGQAVYIYRNVYEGEPVS